MCVTCFAKNENLEVAVAERQIKAPRTDKHIRRCERWQYAKANIAEFFKMDEVEGESGTSKKARVRATVCVAMSEMKDFFAPMLKILAMKAMDEEMALLAAKEYQAWVKENPGANDAERGLMVDKRLDEAMSVWRSFHTKGEAAIAFSLAADYADEWFANLDKKLRVYYVCRAGGEVYPCNTLIASKDWRTLHDDPLATKQRWYCKECNARYMVRFGVVIELLMGDDKLRYMKAELPPQGIMDAKFMSVEGMSGHVQTPQELYDKIKTVSPLAHVNTIAPTKNEGHFKFVGDMKMETMPSMEWEQLFNLVDFKPVVVKKEKK
jgi:hypothetical protein